MCLLLPWLHLDALGPLSNVRLVVCSVRLFVTPVKYFSKQALLCPSPRHTRSNTMFSFHQAMLRNQAY